MPLSIKNPEAEKLAREISKETGESLTAVITNALRDRLERLRGRRHAKIFAQEVDDILHRVDALATQDNRSEDEILGYDSQGLPHNGD
jgi:antitoxin VapB